MLTRRTAQSLPLPLLDLLLEGRLRPAAERTALQQAGTPYNPLLRYITGEEALQALWTAHRAWILEQWITARPGSRPFGWWKYEAPEPRRRLGGVGTLSNDRHPLLELGIPTHWQIARPASVDRRELDPSDPPRYESQAAYLDRLGLLSADERRRLDATAYEDERVS